MSRQRGLAVMQGRTEDPAYGMAWVPVEALRFLTWQDADTEPARILAAVAREFSLDVVFVPAAEPWAADAVAALDEVDVLAVWAVDGVLGRVAATVGWTQVLRMSAGEPGALAASLGEALHDALTDARAGMRAGAGALIVADDLAADAGWLVSPDFALEALMPSYRAIAQVSGWPVAFHSDGDIRALHHAVAAAGFSAVHVAAGDWGSTEAAFQSARAHGLVPMGGIPARALMAEGAHSTGVNAARVAGGLGSVISDDGGMTTPEELAAFGSALAAARAVKEGSGAAQ